MSHSETAVFTASAAEVLGVLRLAIAGFHDVEVTYGRDGDSSLYATVKGGVDMGANHFVLHGSFARVGDEQWKETSDGRHVDALRTIGLDSGLTARLGRMRCQSYLLDVLSNAAMAELNNEKADTSLLTRADAGAMECFEIEFVEGAEVESVSVGSGYCTKRKLELAIVEVGQLTKRELVALAVKLQNAYALGCMARSASELERNAYAMGLSA